MLDAMPEAGPGRHQDLGDDAKTHRDNDDGCATERVGRKPCCGSSTAGCGVPDWHRNLATPMPNPGNVTRHHITVHRTAPVVRSPAILMASSSAPVTRARATKAPPPGSGLVPVTPMQAWRWHGALRGVGRFAASYRGAAATADALFTKGFSLIRSEGPRRRSPE